MDDVLVYESLSKRLLGYASLLNSFADYDENPFSKLCMSIKEFIINCFVKNRINELRFNAVFSVLDILDEKKADDFKDSVLSFFNLRDFVVPQARGRYLEFHAMLSKRLNLLKLQCSPKGIDFLDFALRDSIRDYRRYIMMNHSSDCASMAVNFTNKYYAFLDSLQDKPYKDLLEHLDNYDFLVIDEEYVNSLFGCEVPDELFNGLKEVIDDFSFSVCQFSKNYRFGINATDNVRVWDGLNEYVRSFYI